MSDLTESLARHGVSLPEILLPRAGVDMAAWAVVACDQYSSERDYWEKVRADVGGKPSTLNLIFPECYLEDADGEARIEGIRAAMARYLTEGVLESRGSAFVLVERRTPYEEKPRVGLVMAVDLECYRYGKDSDSLIRPTEGTIVERLPPRMKIRRGAALELPHIMLLVDDPARTLIEPLYAKRQYLPKAYDFTLMAGSGSLRGWFVRDDRDLGGVAAALDRLADPVAYRERYGNEEVLLFAVGDGNHSLATAKAIWEETKKELSGRPDEAVALASHPARYALVELVNIYDEGLPFHPIHRALFGVQPKEMLDLLAAHGARIERTQDAAQAMARVDASGASGASVAAAGAAGGSPAPHVVAFMYEGGAGTATFDAPAANLAAGTIQGILDPWLSGRKGTTIDYIHGAESLMALAGKPGNFGLYLPPVDKAGFFATVVRDGVMPRKTFSMGEAPEKRFYVEARRILP